MTLQIIGTKKSKETQKAVRYCKERGIAFQMIDLRERELSPGELSSILRHVEAEELIDRESAYYKKHGYQYLDYEPVEEIMEHPELMSIPVIRSSKGAVIGFSTEKMQRIIEQP